MSKRKGNRAELKAIKLLEAAGYCWRARNATKTKAVRDGFVRERLELAAKGEQ